jgi:hypothetical protein
MRRLERLSSAFKDGGFWFHNWLGRLLGVGFTAQCYTVAALAAVAALVAAFVDGSLFLNERDIGLLEHLAIWGFFCLQIALPISLRYSTRKLLKARTNLRALGALDGSPSEQLIVPFLKYSRLQGAKIKLLAMGIYCFGLTAFVWNTYQNQLPRIVVPYDFWDSKTYVFGFWVTRLYKLYLFVWLFPYIALLHTAILVTALRLVRLARLSGKLKLLPFHPDGVGGLGFLPQLVTRPLIVGVLLGLLPTVGAFQIHRAADVTPVMGLATLVVATGIAYFIPILSLRADIVAAKRAMIERLRWLQQAKFSQIVDRNNLDFETLRIGNESIEFFEKLCKAIRDISNYPHLKRLIGYITLAMSPVAASLIGKLYNQFGQVIHPLLTRP